MADTKYISKINLGSEEYTIKDTEARTDIANIKSSISKSMTMLGTTTTDLSDNSTTNPITVGGESVTAKAGDVVIKDTKEFVFGEDAKWHLFGTTEGFDNLGDMAYADNGTFTTSSFVTDVADPTINTTPTNISTTYTPDVSVAAPTVTVELNDDTIQPVTDVGSVATYTLPTLTTTVADETLTISFSQGVFDGGSVPTLGTAKTFATTVKSASATAPVVTPTEATITMSYDKATSVTQGTVTKASTTVTVNPVTK